MNQTKAIQAATNHFYTWEVRGRGWHIFPDPVELEPVYVPFFPHLEEKVIIKDDAFTSNIFNRVGSLLINIGSASKKPQPSSYQEQVAEDYKYHAYDGVVVTSFIRFTVSFPCDTKQDPFRYYQLLTMLSGTEHNVSFEIVGTSKDITIQFVCGGLDALRIKLQLKAYCPEATIREYECNAYVPDDGLYASTIEFGLQNEFMLPLNRFNKQSGETYKSFIALLDHLRDDEQITLQILFKGAVNPWGKSILESLIADDGSCFFMDAPEMLDLAKEKTASPLFAVALRCHIQAHIAPRLDDLSREAISALCYQSASNYNFLIPMKEIDAETDVLQRTSHRTGMLLNVEELVNFVHFPDSSVASSKLFANGEKTRSAPSHLNGYPYTLGLNIHEGQYKDVSLDISHRLRHIHIIGATGTGKSTLITNLIGQDMHAGHGLALLDPHGDLVEAVIGSIPENRMQDVVLIDPSDIEYSIGLNLLEANTEYEKIVLSSDFVTAIRRQSTSWGDQMTTILSNAINAFLESSTGGTLFDLRRFLIEDAFRNSFLKTVDDPTIIHFWKKEYAMLRKNAISPILVRLDSFLRPKVVRNMLAQKNGLNFSDMIAENKIVLVKLPQGLIGEENSCLLGTLIVSKIQQAAQARQAITQEKRKPFFLYLDEFQNFITPSMSAILSGSRKYGLGLILAHQDMEQVSKYDSELANSILSNPGTRICFRIGDADARRLEHGFTNFDTTDLQNLHIGKAIAKVETASQDFNLTTYPMPPISKDIQEGIRNRCITHSREQYAKTRADVEANIFSMYDLIPFTKEEDSIQVAENIIKPKASEKAINPAPLFEPIPEITDLEKHAKDFIEQTKERERIKEHRYLQNLIKKMAESKGFKAVIEESTPDGEGRVDVGLLRDNLKIAVEISVTNTNANESKNILKCLNAGYSQVIMCCDNPKHLANIQAATAPQLGEVFPQTVMFCSPIELFAYLDTFNITQEEPENRIKGYRVKVTYKK